MWCACCNEKLHCTYYIPTHVLRMERTQDMNCCMMETLDNGGGRVAVGRAYHGSIPVNFIFYQLYEINWIENTRKKKKRRRRMAQIKKHWTKLLPLYYLVGFCPVANGTHHNNWIEYFWTMSIWWLPHNIVADVTPLGTASSLPKFAKVTIRKIEPLLGSFWVMIFRSRLGSLTSDRAFSIPSFNGRNKNLWASSTWSLARVVPHNTIKPTFQTNIWK